MYDLDGRNYCGFDFGIIISSKLELIKCEDVPHIEVLTNIISATIPLTTLYTPKTSTQRYAKTYLDVKNNTNSKEHSTIQINCILC